jgi:hypothetical protein
MNKKEKTFLVSLVLETIEFVSTIKDALSDKKINLWEMIRIGAEGKDVFQLFKGFSGFDLGTITESELRQVANLIKSEIENDKISEDQVYYALNWIKYTALSIQEARN